MRLASVQCVMRGNALVATVSGEVDMSNAEDIGVEVLNACPENALGVVLDLTSVEHLGSYGIHVIIGLREHLKDRGQALVLVSATRSPPHRVLELAGVTKSMPTMQAVDPALRALAA